MEYRDFLRAAREVGAHGDNDTLPFDGDSRFVKACAESLAYVANGLYERCLTQTPAEVREELKGYEPFSERLLVPTGSAGFRVVTKIHPFWNIFLNGLGVSIARVSAPLRSGRAHSYRFVDDDDAIDIFDRSYSWRAFRLASVDAAEQAGDDAVVIQTDISSFYERISHHHIENMLGSMLDEQCSVQVNALLSRFSAGRSFALPVGGQFSRIVAESFMLPIDQALDRRGVNWFRYVDDYVMVAPDFHVAHEHLAYLSKQLSEFGLSLNRTKTTILRASSFADYVRAQLGADEGEVGLLKEIDLHFDPYSDSPLEDYESLRATIESLDVQKLLSLELEKSVPDNFLVAQVGRTLEFHSPEVALDLVKTLLSEASLRSFRGSWSTIMRGVAHLRTLEGYQHVHEEIDCCLDRVLTHSRYLLTNEGSQLHFLRALRFSPSRVRAAFVWGLYEESASVTVKRGCIDCVSGWATHGDLNAIANRWSGMHAEVRRAAWICSKAFGREGVDFRRQRRTSLVRGGQLGFEQGESETFSVIFERWAREQA
ncbi:reverse transcriptase [compost metagenome]